MGEAKRRGTRAQRQDAAKIRKQADFLRSVIADDLNSKSEAAANEPMPVVHGPTFHGIPIMPITSEHKYHSQIVIGQMASDGGTFYVRAEDWPRIEAALKENKNYIGGG